MMKDKAWPEIEARIEKEDGQLIAYAEKYLQWLYAVDDYLGDEIDPTHSGLVKGKIVAFEEILRLARGELKAKGKRE
jgi:hypothetical protein